MVSSQELQPRTCLRNRRAYRLCLRVNAALFAESLGSMSDMNSVQYVRNDSLSQAGIGETLQDAAFV